MCASETERRRRYATAARYCLHIVKDDDLWIDSPFATGTSIIEDHVQNRVTSRS